MCLETLKVKSVSLSSMHLSCRDNGIEIPFLELVLTKDLTIGGHPNVPKVANILSIGGNRNWLRRQDKKIPNRQMFS